MCTRQENADILMRTCPRGKRQEAGGKRPGKSADADGEGVMVQVMVLVTRRSGAMSALRISLAFNQSFLTDLGRSEACRR